MNTIRSFQKDINDIAKKTPNNPALIVKEDVNPVIITYRELIILIDRCLLFFQELGIKPGDTIVAILPDKVETLIIFLATIKGGYIFSPLPCTVTKRELTRWLYLTSPDLCFVTSLIKTELLDILFDNQIPTHHVMPDSKFLWLTDLSNDVSLLIGDSPLLYISTSGTTGEPKAMVIDSNRLWSSGCAFMQVHNLHQSQLRFWNYLPMSYLGGLFNLGLIPLCIGGSVLIDEAFSGRSFLQFWQTVERFEIDVLWFVPSIVNGLLKIAETSSSIDMKKRSARIKIAFLGTAPISLSSKKKFKEIFDIELLENYALSETTFCTTEKSSDVIDKVEGGIGTKLPYIDLKLNQIMSDDESTHAYEICIKSLFQFLGYLEEPGQVKTHIDEDGYFHTGDLGYLDENDVLIINGRKRDIIKKGGYFVSLREIEVLAESHPLVFEAAAVKFNHAFYGESYNLFVVIAKEVTDDFEKTIMSFIHSNLVAYKWPNQIIIKNSFPRTNSGKVIKHLLASFN